MSGTEDHKTMFPGHKKQRHKKMKPCLHASLTLHNISAQFNNEGLSQGEKYQYFIFYIDPRWPFLCQVQMTLYLCFNFLYLFSPTNSIFSPLFFVQIMLLSDPEMESSILISSDEGATYQKYRLTFYIQSLLFHPKQEDWVLAYSLDQKVNKYCFHSHLVTQVPLV